MREVEVIVIPPDLAKKIECKEHQPIKGYFVMDGERVRLWICKRCNRFLGWID
jgi:hypothetical protein